jgi:hypothetical protein
MKARDAMTLAELAGQERWFTDLADIYRDKGMEKTAAMFRSVAAEYRVEMERRPDTAE